MRRAKDYAVYPWRRTDCRLYNADLTPTFSALTTCAIVSVAGACGSCVIKIREVDWMEQRFLMEQEPQDREVEKLLQADAVTGAKQDIGFQVGSPLPAHVVDAPKQQSSEADAADFNPGAMLPQEREALLDQLTRQAHAEKRQHQWFVRLSTLATTLLIICNSAHLFAIKIAVYFAVPIIFIYVAAIICAGKARRRLGKTAQKMTQLDDPRAIGPLLAALYLNDPDVVGPAENALLRLLPRLQASDAKSITEAQRECLYQRLTIDDARSKSEFLIAALQAVEQIGDAKAVPYVEALAASTYRSMGARRVREAAIHCLPFLKARAEQKEWSDNLLRASSGQDTPSDALLLPVTDGSPTDPQHLLRSSGPTGLKPPCRTVVRTREIHCRRENPWKALYRSRRNAL